jgi:hypothetical protein
VTSRAALKGRADVIGMILDTWRTNNQVTSFWSSSCRPGCGQCCPGRPRPIRMIAGHLHNTRAWIKTLGQEVGSPCPAASTGGGSGARN